MRPRIKRHCNQTSATPPVPIGRPNRPLHVTLITDRRRIDLADVAHLISRRHPDLRLDPSRFRSRLRTALHNSLVCVAAYALESQVLATDLSTSSQSVTDPYLPRALDRFFDDVLKPFAMYRETRPQVLVGFARAVGDTSLVATIHDVVVAPEARRRGVGAALLEKLTSEV